MACSTDLTRVNFRGWFTEAFQEIEGCPAADWVLQKNGFAALQTQNGQPSMFCSDFNVFDLFGSSGVTFTGEVEVLPPNDLPNVCQALNRARDDDYWGFAIGYQSGDNSFENAQNADYVLIDFKARSQTYSESCERAVDGICVPCDCDQSIPGWNEASVGLSLSRIQDLIHTDEFWSHVDCDCGPNYPGRIKEYARGFLNSNNPWEFRAKRKQRGLGTYKFRFDFGPEEIAVFLDDWNNPEMVLRASDTDLHGGLPFQDGRLCFYNYSQENVRYKAFNAEENCSNPPSPDPPSGKGKGGKGKGGSKGSGSKGKGKGKGGRLVANRRKKNRVYAQSAGAVSSNGGTPASGEEDHNIFKRDRKTQGERQEVKE